jgi:hypothetical protein
MGDPFTLDTAVALPKGLTPKMVKIAVDYLERETSSIVDVYYEQRNAFSTIVGIYGAKGLASVSPFEPNPHRLKAQGTFPDLYRKGSTFPIPPQDTLESKGSKRPWALQAHYDHEGWFIVWRYLVDETQAISGKPVVVWRVDVTYLTKGDWQYEKSSAGPDGGGRTHTFGVRLPNTRFAGKAVYSRVDLKLSGGKPVPI